MILIAIKGRSIRLSERGLNVVMYISESGVLEGYAPQKLYYREFSGACQDHVNFN